MLEFKDVSYKEILCKYLNTDFEIHCRLNNVENLEDVYKLYLKYNKKERIMLDRDFHEMFKRLNLTNIRNGSPNVYFTNDYSDKSLEYNDGLNKGDILIFDNPTNSFISRTFNDVKKMNIRDIKYDLSHCMINGYNYLRFICNRIGPDKLLIVQRALNYYIDQIERQAKIIPDRNINLFKYEHDERYSIVNNMIDEVINYLLKNAKEELVWGYLNEPRRVSYISSLTNDNKTDRQIRDMVSEYVSNYITIDEANDLRNHDDRVLKRFIIK